MTAGIKSRFAWPDDGVTRVPYFVYEDAELYQLEQERVFRGPVWNFLGLEIELPSPGDYITNSSRLITSLPQVVRVPWDRRQP